MTRYVCSRCGYSRDSVESVVEHIAESHPGPGSAHVMTHEEEPPTPLHVRFVALIRRLMGNN